MLGFLFELEGDQRKPEACWQRQARRERVLVILTLQNATWLSCPAGRMEGHMGQVVSDHSVLFSGSVLSVCAFLSNSV